MNERFPYLIPYLMATRWADIADESEENESEDEGVFVTVRLPNGRSTHVVMEAGALIGELNQWIQDTEGIHRNSFALSCRGQYLTRQILVPAPSCELHLVKRLDKGRPRGMALRR